MHNDLGGKDIVFLGSLSFSVVGHYHGNAPNVGACSFHARPLVGSVSPKTDSKHALP